MLPTYVCHHGPAALITAPGANNHTELQETSCWSSLAGKGSSAPASPAPSGSCHLHTSKHIHFALFLLRVRLKQPAHRPLLAQDREKATCLGREACTDIGVCLQDAHTSCTRCRRETQAGFRAPAAGICSPQVLVSLAVTPSSKMPQPLRLLSALCKRLSLGAGNLPSAAPGAAADRSHLHSSS